MKRVSLKDLKAKLSSVVAEAESGQTIEITRHEAPVARVGPAQPPYVHRGARAGVGALQPGPKKRLTKGRYLAILLEDRGTR